MSLVSKQLMRGIASVVGIGLLIGALVAIARSAPTIDQLRSVLARPDGVLIVGAIAAAFCNLVGSGGLFYALLRHHGRVGFWQMQALIASSTVLNFVPLRPGLVGRVAYQAVVCGIPIKRSMMSIAEAAIICAATTAWLALAVFLLRTFSTPVAGAVVGAAPVLLGVTLAMDAKGAYRAYLEAIFWRWLDLLAWVARYWIVFAMLGVPLTIEGAATAACIGSAANLIPLVGSGLGVREWAIGLAGPALASWSTDSGLAAELLNRCIDMLVVVPIGLWAMPRIEGELRAHCRPGGPRPPARDAGK